VGDVTGLEDEGPGVEASQLIGEPIAAPASGTGLASPLGEVAEAVVLPGWRRWWCWNTAPVGVRVWPLACRTF